MSLNTENVEYLVHRFNTGKISPEELQTLTNWYNSHDDQHIIITSAKNESHDQVKSRILKGLLSKLENDEVKQVSLYRKLSLSIVAAAVFFVGLGIWAVQEIKNTSQDSRLMETSIKPGSNKATITLADGRTIVLSDSQTGIIAGETITYVNGKPVEQAYLDSADKTQSLAFHTPRGGTYSIILQDGTQVWLNAQSTLKYPSRFEPDERSVEIEGEAYFKVKTIYHKNGKKVPFKVISKRQTVEVLGTEFNMNTYSDQEASKTTLVEGKVAIRDAISQFTLSPNQQAVTANGKTKVGQVNSGNYTAWRDGKFVFDDKTFEETMSEIGRWYDLDVVYENDIPKEELVGDAFRNQNISFVLRLLDVAEINYTLDVNVRKITIRGKKSRIYN